VLFGLITEEYQYAMHCAKSDVIMLHFVWGTIKINIKIEL